MQVMLTPAARAAAVMLGYRAPSGPITGRGGNGAGMILGSGSSAPNPPVLLCRQREHIEAVLIPEARAASAALRYTVPSGARTGLDMPLALAPAPPPRWNRVVHVTLIDV